MSSLPGSFGLNALGGRARDREKNGFQFRRRPVTHLRRPFGRREPHRRIRDRSASSRATSRPSTLRRRAGATIAVLAHQLYARSGGEASAPPAPLFAGDLEPCQRDRRRPRWKLLACSRSAISTSPQSTRNDLGFLNACRRSKLTGQRRGARPRRQSLLAALPPARRQKRHNSERPGLPMPAFRRRTALLRRTATLLFAPAPASRCRFRNGSRPRPYRRSSTVADGSAARCSSPRNTPIFDAANISSPFSPRFTPPSATAPVAISARSSRLCWSAQWFDHRPPAGDVAPVASTRPSS